MSATKAFISYCGQNKELAIRIARRLKSIGCSSWQFDVSAVPGTDAWDTILSRIEESDYFIVLLSRAATASRSVLEEIGHAHYRYLNSDAKLPRLIPLILEEGVSVPRQIVRSVRLPFREEDFDNCFEDLAKSMGLESSLFRSPNDLIVTVSLNRDFDVIHEAAVFAECLIQQHPEVAKLFSDITRETREFAGGRFRVWAPRMLEWSEDRSRHYFEDGQRGRRNCSDIFAFFSVDSGCSSGTWSHIEAVVRIFSESLLRFTDVGENRELASNQTTLKYVGIYPNDDSFAQVLRQYEDWNAFLDRGRSL